MIYKRNFLKDIEVSKNYLNELQNHPLLIKVQI